MSGTTDRYFEDQWADSDDPWDQIARFSEQRKYDLTVASLPRARYRRAFEPGCATGSLTERLARRVGSILAADRHPRAVEATVRRCRGLRHVAVDRLTVPSDWPDGTFDLIVLSEIAYYFDRDTLGRLLARVQASLETGGHVLACHFRPTVPQHALPGDTVHGLIRDRGWRVAVEHAEPSFLLDVFEVP